MTLRRLLALVVALCFCLPMLIFFSYASDDQQGFLYFDLANGSSIQNDTFLPFSNYKHHIDYITIFPLEKSYTDIYFSFDVVCPGASLSWDDGSLLQNRPVLYQSTSMQFAVSRYLYEDNGTTWDGLHFVAHLTIKNSNINPQTLLINHNIVSLSQASNITGAYVTNFVCTSDKYEILRIIYGRIDSFQAHFDSWVSNDSTGWAFAANNIDILRGYLFDLRKKLTVDSYTYRAIQYDENGNVDIEDLSDPWYLALLNSITSIVAPIAEQAKEEQKAKDAGAYDAFEKGYDTSDFGAISDIFDLSGFGEYNDTEVEQAAGDGPNDWFSLYTKNSLDQVEEWRYRGDGYISFYQSNLDNILSYFGTINRSLFFNGGEDRSE